MEGQDRQEPIAALATPYGRSAIAVIRAGGSGIIERIDPLFRGRGSLLKARGHTLHHGTLVDGEVVVDEVVIGLYRGPKSYTGEDSIEIFAHGSRPGIERILDLLFRHGVRAAEPGEFTLRAFLNGKLDLTRAEAVREIVDAQTSAAQQLALSRLGGAVEGRINKLKDALVRILAALSIQLDYPEEETGEIPIDPGELRRIRGELLDLAATYRTGRIYQEGVRVALGGRTNAGKSSLFNALLREERAIVSDVHGTTRDYLEASIDLDGIPVLLFDTAGLREVEEAIESEGIRRSRGILKQADLVVYLVDGSEGLVEEDLAFLEEEAAGAGASVIRVWNKGDLPELRLPPEGFITVSALAGTGISALLEEIRARALPEERSRTGEPVIDSLRQKNLLEAAAESVAHIIEGVEAEMPADVISLDVQEAVNALGEITGEVTTADLLETMFDGFCVGK
ncbi:MAG: tRNA uridine-5-carboxymethylaminomethyl(34) synthesis GTPase MnmE [Alkalispirochaetaceae bacterium]